MTYTSSGRNLGPTYEQIFLLSEEAFAYADMTDGDLYSHLHNLRVSERRREQALATGLPFEGEEAKKLKRRQKLVDHYSSLAKRWSRNNALSTEILGKANKAAILPPDEREKNFVSLLEELHREYENIFREFPTKSLPEGGGSESSE